MILQSPGPILLQLGPLSIHWYGVMIALGLVVAFLAADKLAERFDLEKEVLINCGLVAFLSGIIGARLYFVALSWDYFKEHLLQIPATWLGGLSIHGGMIGATIGSVLFCRLQKLPILRVCDLFAACVPIGQAVGRWGNFFNSELFGRPWESISFSSYSFR